MPCCQLDQSERTSSTYVLGIKPSGSSSSPLKAFFFAFHQSSSVLFSRIRSRSPSEIASSPSLDGAYSKIDRYTPTKPILDILLRSEIGHTRTRDSGCRGRIAGYRLDSSQIPRMRSSSGVRSMVAQLAVQCKCTGP